jgi:esterase
MELNYKKIGEGHPVIILHGLFGSSDNWQTMGKSIAELGHAVYLVDLRNHGHSPRSEEMNFGAMSQDVYELLEKEKLEKVILMGHSMGGKTAMTFASNHPERVDKLIVVDIGPQKYASHHDLILKALNAVDTNIVNERKQAEQIIANYIEDVSVSQFLLKNLYWKEKGILDWRFNLPVIEKNMDNILDKVIASKFEKPTLFMRGAMSGYITNGDFDLILKIYPNAEIVTIKNAGHWLHAEAPKEFLEIFENFVT